VEGFLALGVTPPPKSGKIFIIKDLIRLKPRKIFILKVLMPKILIKKDLAGMKRSTAALFSTPISSITKRNNYYAKCKLQ
jgi:hypothetical protein